MIFRGNSGGPLVNLQGEIVGINEVSLGSLGGAIPSNLAKHVVGEDHQDRPRHPELDGHGVPAAARRATRASTAS